MKFTAALSLLVTIGVSNAEYSCNYNPTEDVTDHSKSAVDVAKVTDLVVNGNTDDAYLYYTSDTVRLSPTKTLEATADKDWAASGAPDEIYQSYESVLGADFLDSYNTDSINCDGTFAGKSASMCATAAKKNVICTTLAYGLYEVAKAAGDAGTEKNWDEGFAFWNGLYDEVYDGTELGIDDVELGKYSGGGIQDNRDGNFATSNKEACCDAFKAAQSESKDKKAEEIGNIANGLVNTFAQATLKYAAEMITAEGDDKKDAKWAEGYTYFRCAAGLFDSDFATYVESRYSPLTNSFPSGNEMYCDIAMKMHETSDLGYGVSMSDLGTENFEATMNIAEDCGLLGELGEGNCDHDDHSAAPNLKSAVATSLICAVGAYLV